MRNHFRSQLKVVEIDFYRKKPVFTWQFIINNYYFFQNGDIKCKIFENSNGNTRLKSLGNVIFVQLEQNLLQTVIFHTKLKSVDVYWSDLRSIPYFLSQYGIFFPALKWLDCSGLKQVNWQARKKWHTKNDDELNSQNEETNKKKIS